MGKHYNSYRHVSERVRISEAECRSLVNSSMLRGVHSERDLRIVDNVWGGLSTQRAIAQCYGISPTKVQTICTNVLNTISRSLKHGGLSGFYEPISMDKSIYSGAVHCALGARCTSLLDEAGMSTMGAVYRKCHKLARGRERPRAGRVIPGCGPEYIKVICAVCKRCAQNSGCTCELQPRRSGAIPTTK